MHATLHQIDSIPGPQDRSWVDEVLAAISALASPVGALVACAIGDGPGHLVAFWTGPDDAATVAHGVDTGSVTIGEARTYEIDARSPGAPEVPARFLQLLVFDGPRTPQWSAAYERAGTDRMYPAVRHLSGWVQHLGGSGTDNGKVSISLADSVETLEAAGAAIMSTELLPGEDPDQLTGPDSFAILRLLHADVPAGAGQMAARS